MSFPSLFHRFFYLFLAPGLQRIEPGMDIGVDLGRGVGDGGEAGRRGGEREMKHPSLKAQKSNASNDKYKIQAA